MSSPPRTLRPATLPRFALAACFATACTGMVVKSEGDGNGGPPGTGSASGGGLPSGPVKGVALGRQTEADAKSCPSVLDPGPSRLRRLNRREYNNTVTALLFDSTDPAKDFPSDERRLNFDNNAEVLTVSPPLVEAYLQTAEALATRAVATNFAKIVPCDPAKNAAACETQFLETFGKRAFRRPLSSDELSIFRKVFDQGALTDFKTGVALVIEATLQSAPFLYRAELGDPAGASVMSGGTKLLPLSAWEMASRLSYFLWSSPPDDALFAAADKNQLTTKAQIRQQVTRMLADPKARTMTGAFHEQWLALADLATLDKDSTLFPLWAPSSTSDLKEETARFIEDIVWSGSGKFPDLFTSSSSVLNSKVAALYGLSGSGLPTGDADWKKVSLDPKQRRGLLTQGSILAMEAKANQTNPVLRGKFVRVQMLCDIPPPPPNDIMIRAPDVDPKLTTRERFAAHRTEPRCAACHQLLDPLGLGLENYDPIGRYRETENGKTVDASGEVVAASDDRVAADPGLYGPYNGAVELSDKLAKSNDVKRCYVNNWFRFAYARTEAPEDVCLLHKLDAAFVDGEFDIKRLVTALTDTEAFYYVRAGGTQ